MIMLIASLLWEEERHLKKKLKEHFIVNSKHYGAVSS